MSPLSDYNGMWDKDPIANTQYVLEGLSERKIAFVEVMENLSVIPGKNEELREKFFADKPKKTLRGLLRDKFNGAWIANF